MFKDLFRAVLSDETIVKMNKKVKRSEVNKTNKRSHKQTFGRILNTGRGVKVYL